MLRRDPFVEGGYYHLYNRGVDKRKIFLDKEDYQRFVALLYLCNSHDNLNLVDYFREGKKLKDAFDEQLNKRIVAIGAYCLMPNHFHLLATELVDNGISTFMKKIATAYVMYFNRKNNRTGTLFEGRFKSQHAESDEYLKYLYSYIHLNPAKLVDRGWAEHCIASPAITKKFVKEYPYSSYPDFLSAHRKERTVLSREKFPDYFETATDVDEMITDWLTKDRPF